MKIWAHRGCSQRYPENTLLAFEKAMVLKNLTGIELDIQLTKDDHIVVFHDERVDRVTDGIGQLKEFTFSGLKRLQIETGGNRKEHIPALQEVFDILEPRLKNGLLLNIELKNGIIPYDGMEEKIVEMVHKSGLQNSVIYSSFYALSLKKLRRLDPEAGIGVLDSRLSDCLFKLKGGCGANALHPFWRGLDVPMEDVKGYAVRAWLSGHLYPEKPTGTKLDLTVLEQKGITDIFLNEPEI